MWLCVISALTDQDVSLKSDPFLKHKLITKHAFLGLSGHTGRILW